MKFELKKENENKEKQNMVKWKIRWLFCHLYLFPQRISDSKHWMVVLEGASHCFELN